MRRVCAAAGAALLFVALAGCWSEPRVVRYHPFLGGLPGAESGTPVTGPRGAEHAVAANAPNDKIVVENADGTKTLHARTGRHLMIHVFTTLQEGDEALFTDQVLSEMTKREYRERGMDPAGAFRTLKEHEEDVMRLFRAMPMGEFSAGVYNRPAGGGVRRIELSGAATRGMRWQGIDMVMERGEWRLRWLVTGPGRDIDAQLR